MTPLVDAGVTLDTGAVRDAGTTPTDTGTTPADTGSTPTDAGPAADTGATPDAGGVVTSPDPQSAEDIASIRAAQPGPIDVTLTQVMVTTVRPEIGRDAAGFFVQATQAGPAIFVAHDPAPAGLQAGSIVNFRATECADSFGQRIVATLTGLEVVGQGDHTALIQDVSDATDLVSDLGDYEAELLSAQVTIVGSMTFAGNSFVASTVDTNGLAASDLRFRIPDSVQAEVNLAPGCVLSFVGPMWRYRDTPQLSVYTADAISDINCPGTIILEAVAARPTELRLGFSRDLQADSLQANGSQFSVNGLDIVSASLSGGSTVVLTTAAQEDGAAYTATVDDTLLDAAGNALDPEGRSIEFAGFSMGLRLRITELSANITSGCDRIELVALGAGSIEGFAQGADLYLDHLPGDHRRRQRPHPGARQRHLGALQPERNDHRDAERGAEPGRSSARQRGHRLGRLDRRPRPDRHRQRVSGPRRRRPDPRRGLGLGRADRNGCLGVRASGGCRGRRRRVDDA